MIHRCRVTAFVRIISGLIRSGELFVFVDFCTTAGTRTWAASARGNRRPGSRSPRWMAAPKCRCRRRASRTEFSAAVPSSSSVAIRFCAPHHRPVSASAFPRDRARHPLQTGSVSDLFFVAQVPLPFRRPGKPRTYAPWCVARNSTSTASRIAEFYRGVLRWNLLLLFNFSLETYIKCFPTFQH